MFEQIKKENARHEKKDHCRFTETLRFDNLTSLPLHLHTFLFKIEDKSNYQKQNQRNDLKDYTLMDPQQQQRHWTL